MNLKKEVRSWACADFVKSVFWEGGRKEGRMRKRGFVFVFLSRDLLVILLLFFCGLVFCQKKKKKKKKKKSE